MSTLFVLMLPAFVAAGILYLLMTLGDAVTTAAGDWIEDRHEVSHLND